jgi:hypothetical protein
MLRCLFIFVLAVSSSLHAEFENFKASPSRISPTGPALNCVVPLEEISGDRTGQEFPRFSLEDHTFANPVLLREPNFGASYSVLIDEKKSVVRFAVLQSNLQYTKIAKTLSDAGFGVPFRGVITEPLERVTRKLGISARDLKSTSEILVFDYVDGIEIKGSCVLRNSSKIPLETLDSGKVKNQLEAFLAFCNEKGIRIGGDFQYFVTRDSKVIVFDYDLYGLWGEPSSELTAGNAERMRPIIDVWKDGIHFDFVAK